MKSEVDGTPAAADASDWEQRRLCSDESCIGVIGPDGRCKECGRPYAGTTAGAAPPPWEPPAAVNATELPSEEVEPAEADAQWESRRLCSDENCIGVIGPDGRCKECGRPFSA